MPSPPARFYRYRYEPACNDMAQDTARSLHSRPAQRNGCIGAYHRPPAAADTGSVITCNHRKNRLLLVSIFCVCIHS